MMKEQEAHRFIATAPFGLEGVVAEELRAMGMRQVRAGEGGARFEGSMLDAFHVNLQIRCADRVLLIAGEFPAESFEALFQGVSAIPWERYIPPDASFPVRGNCARSQLMSVRDCQAITKKAIVERLKARRRAESLPETGEAYGVQVGIHQNQVTVTLDTSGEGLSRRGYRTWNGEAPLRETLAASLLKLSPWKPGIPLYDPLCGTGTLLIEAAWISANYAPGLERAFACERWRWAPAKQMEGLRLQAREAVRLDAVRQISGADISADALMLAGRHMAQAGIGKRIPLVQRDVRDALPLLGKGVLVTNPPYGERMSDRKGCESVAKGLRRMQDASLYTLCVFTAFRGFEKAFGRRADKRRRLYNGRLECEWMTFYPDSQRGGKPCK